MGHSSSSKLHHTTSGKSYVYSSITAATMVIGLFAALPCHAQAPPRPASAVLVVCAPGYPGSTMEAQVAMDTLAAAITSAAGWKAGALAAIYFETEAGGLDRLAKTDAALALVPLTFWLKHQATLRLTPQFQAVQQGGEAAEVWTLVAAKGAITGPASLAGYDLVSLAGYVPRFVRGPALGSWGELPAHVNIVFSSALLSGLRKAANGEKVALLLDRAQAASLSTLPFAQKLEVVTHSAPLPVSVLCTVNNRMPQAKLKGLLKALSELGMTPTGDEALKGVRLARFVPTDLKALAQARDAYSRSKD